jgi:DNA polymerase-3 subunit gamma/tau
MAVEPVRHAMPAPAAEPVAAPRSMREIAALVAERREASLHAHLVQSAHLVRIAPPILELRVEPQAPRDLAARLAALLQAATGTRWTIALSAAEGEPTLAEQAAAAAAARRHCAAEHPLVRAIMEAFPGAEISQVRDPAADAYGLAPEAEVSAPFGADAAAQADPLAGPLAQSAEIGDGDYSDDED